MIEVKTINFLLLLHLHVTNNYEYNRASHIHIWYSSRAPDPPTQKGERVWWKGLHCHVCVECNIWHFYVHSLETNRHFRTSACICKHTYTPGATDKYIPITMLLRSDWPRTIFNVGTQCGSVSLFTRSFLPFCIIYREGLLRETSLVPHSNLEISRLCVHISHVREFDLPLLHPYNTAGWFLCYFMMKLSVIGPYV
jgi:hypothetical protein